MLSGGKDNIIQQLQKDVLAMQGFKRAGMKHINTGLGPIETAFPNSIFPLGTIHEFLSVKPQDSAATDGFMAGLLSTIAQNGKCIWVSNRRQLFPAALKKFGISPKKVIFIDLLRQKEVLWTLEEALKCKNVAAVVGELQDLGFNESRRLQLAVEDSKVAGFIHRQAPKSLNPIASVARWSIRRLLTNTYEQLSGPGLPRWEVNLLKVRNRVPGSWQVEWMEGGYRHLDSNLFRVSETHVRQTA